MSDRIRNNKIIVMTEGPIWSRLLAFTMPILLGNVFQLLYNTVDSVIVGKFVGTGALAAVGATAQICGMLVRFFNGLSAGAGAVISQCFGAKYDEKLCNAVHTTMSMTLIICVLFTAFGVGLSKTMLGWISTPEDIIDDAALYLKIYFSGISGLLIYNMGTAILRAVGDTKRPLYFLIFCSFCNIALDLVAVLILKMGVAGVAWATIISQAASAVFVMVVLSRETGAHRFSFKKLSLDPSIAASVIKVGMPVAIQQCVVCFSNMFVQKYINAFGTSKVASWTIYTKLDQYLILPIQSLGMAMSTFTGQNIGAEKCDRARKGTKEACGICLAVSALVIAILLVFTNPLVGIFTGDQEVMKVTAEMIRTCSPFAFLLTFTYILSGCMRGGGDTRAPMIIYLTAQVLIRQIYVYLASVLIPGSIRAVVFCYPVGWICSSSGTFIYYSFFSKWDRQGKLI